MENKVINQVLAELEDSLANLESARNQVNNVSKKSEDLVFEFSNILRQLDIIEKERLFDSSEFKKKVDDSYVKFNKKIELTNKDFKNKYEVVSDQFKNEIYSILEKLKILESDLDKLNNTIVNTEGRISSFDLTIVFKELKSRIEDLEINHTNGVKFIQSQITSGFESLTENIKGVDTKESLIDLNNNIEHIFKEIIINQNELIKKIKVLNNEMVDNSNKTNKSQIELVDSIQSLKFNFESKLNSSISSFKRTMILIHFGTFGLFGIALLGVILKLLRYI